jgi:hypothetical protein
MGLGAGSADLLYDPDHVGVRVSAVHLQLGNEAVDLVEDQAGSNVLLPCLSDDSDSLGPNAFDHLARSGGQRKIVERCVPVRGDWRGGARDDGDYVDEDEGSIAKS